MINCVFTLHYLRIFEIYECYMLLFVLFSDTREHDGNNSLVCSLSSIPTNKTNQSSLPNDGRDCKELPEMDCCSEMSLYHIFICYIFFFHLMQ